MYEFVPVRTSEGVESAPALSRRRATRGTLAGWVGMARSTAPLEHAERLNRPLGTIKTWMRSGLQSLRASWRAPVRLNGLLPFWRSAKQPAVVHSISMDGERWRR